jgi:hypothetical protein
MSKSRDIADSAATINYIDGLTSDAQTQINGKATLDASPTFTGTVTATAFSGDGSGLTGVDSLPSQTGNNGLFLTTDGSTASWGEAGGGAWEFLGKVTASNSASIEFTSISSDYGCVVAILQAVKPDSDNRSIYFKTSTNNGSSYNDPTQTSHTVGQPSSVSYAQTTSAITSNDVHYTGIPVSGTLFIYNLNSSKNTTFTGHLIYDRASTSNILVDTFSGGYTTAQVDNAIQFTSNINIESGSILLYGIKES